MSENENTFEWFQAQAADNKKHIEQNWPKWMKETSAISTASFPLVDGKPLVPKALVSQPHVRLKKAG